MYKTSRHETHFDPSIPERAGWEGMHVHWLADRDHGRTQTAVFNVTEFPPKRWHELHRHPDAEEYFFVLEGAGLHLTEGEPVRLEKGDLVFVPKGEWHGFANDSDEPTLAVTVLGGVAHYRDAGYEVHPAQPAVTAAH
jgi:quercetin dioxygenase-like cupin family protein